MAAMKTIVYSCPFIPAEWIAAHGMRPSRILPGAEGRSTSSGAHEGVCPYASSFAHSVRSEGAADAVVFTTVCDQMRRISEWTAAESDLPLFLMHVPSTWRTAAAQQLYVDELRRLGRFLVRLGGSEPSPEKLANVMREYERLRSALRDARGRLSARRYSEAIASFHRDGTLDQDASGSVRTTRGVALALVGGPLMLHHYRMFDFIENHGGYVALDATTTGERTMPAPFDRRALGDDPLLALADAYFGSIPDAFRRPNSLLYQWLKREMSARGIRGIVLRHYLWCDTWHAEAQRMKEWSELPLLALEVGADDPVDGHAASRIESFIEMLK